MNMNFHHKLPVPKDIKNNIPEVPKWQKKRLREEKK